MKYEVKMRQLYKLVEGHIDRQKIFTEIIEKRLSEGWELRGELVVSSNQNLFQVLIKWVKDDETQRTD